MSFFLLWLMTSFCQRRVQSFFPPSFKNKSFSEELLWPASFLLTHTLGEEVVVLLHPYTDAVLDRLWLSEQSGREPSHGNTPGVKGTS